MPSGGYGRRHKFHGWLSMASGNSVEWAWPWAWPDVSTVACEGGLAQPSRLQTHRIQ